MQIALPWKMLSIGTIRIRGRSTIWLQYVSSRLLTSTEMMPRRSWRESAKRRNSGRIAQKIDDESEKRRSAEGRRGRIAQKID